MTKLLAHKIDEVRTTGVRLLELLDEIKSDASFVSDASFIPETSRTYSDFALANVREGSFTRAEVGARISPSELFSEPAWDMLLNLFAAQMAEQTISITSACLATSAHATTALRWLDILQNLRLVERYACGRQAKRSQHLANYLSCTHHREPVTLLFSDPP